ncbi:MAG: GNAT family N-acetyltransferase [Candidatus Omnitrophica bacterium]|nr:GNAT family N-acetyltransferase [Candidatus Omnitrophota bacterium]
MKYLVLEKDSYQFQEYSLVALREEDILLIKDWRNAQILILRQNKPLTEPEQIEYYNQVVIPSFSQAKPSIILFSFLKKEMCIGYGGLVHIDWSNKRAELSFLLNPERVKDKNLYEVEFTIFIKLIKEIAFKELKLNKVYTETFDLNFRSHHISILEKNGFTFEGRLRQHIYKENKFIDSLIHSILGEEYELEK